MSAHGVHALSRVPVHLHDEQPDAATVEPHHQHHPDHDTADHHNGDEQPRVDDIDQLGATGVVVDVGDDAGVGHLTATGDDLRSGILLDS